MGRLAFWAKFCGLFQYHINYVDCVFIVVVWWSVYSSCELHTGLMVNHTIGDQPIPTSSRWVCVPIPWNKMCVTFDTGCNFHPGAKVSDKSTPWHFISEAATVIEAFSLSLKTKNKTLFTLQRKSGLILVLSCNLIIICVKMNSAMLQPFQGGAATQPFGCVM